MQLSFRAIVIAIVFLSLVTGVMSAQKKPGDRSRALLMRNYETGTTDAMRVVVYKVERGIHAPVDPSRRFTQGEEIRVAFEANFDGFVYFVNVSPGGKSRVLFPYPDEIDNTVRSRRRYQLPKTGVLAFDQEKGVEILQVIMSRDRVPLLDDAVRNANGELGGSAKSAAAELAARSGIVSDNIAMVLTGAGVRSRGIKLSQGKDKDKQGSLISMDGKLKSGEVAVFEIRLKHV